MSKSEKSAGRREMGILFLNYLWDSKTSTIIKAMVKNTGTKLLIDKINTNLIFMQVFRIYLKPFLQIFELHRYGIF